MHPMHFEPAARLPPKQKAPVQSMLLSPPSRQPAHRSHRQPSQPPLQPPTAIAATANEVLRAVAADNAAVADVTGRWHGAVAATGLCKLRRLAPGIRKGATHDEEGGGGTSSASGFVEAATAIGPAIAS